MNKPIFAQILIAISVCTLNSVYAAETGSAFLKIMPSARIQGISAGVALSGETQDMYANPAGPASVKGLEASTGYVALIENSKLENIVLSHDALGGRMFYGFTYVSYGDMEARDTSGNQTGSFTASDMALQAGYARRFGKLSLGAAIKGVRNRIDKESGMGFGFDAGAQVKCGMLKFGAALLNAGRSGKVGSQTEDLPMTVSAGVSTGIQTITLAAEARRNIPEKRTIFAGGAELAIMKTIYLRVGYSRDITTKGAPNTDNLKGLSLGCGLKLNRYRIDYAYLSQGELGGNQRFTITAKF